MRLIWLFGLLAAAPLLEILAEEAYRASVLRPVILSDFFADPALQADIQASSTQRSFRWYDAGNTLTQFCGSGPEVSFNWEDYGRVEILLAQSPDPSIKGTVRILRACDLEPCVYVERSRAYVRPATSEELEIARPYSQVRDCQDRQYGIYDAQFCRTVEYTDGETAGVFHDVYLDQPLLLGYLADVKQVNLCGVIVSFVRSGTSLGRCPGQLELPENGP